MFSKLFNMCLNVVKAGLTPACRDINVLTQVAYVVAREKGLTVVNSVSTNPLHYMLLTVDGFNLVNLIKQGERDVVKYRQLFYTIPNFGKGMLIISRPERHPDHHLLTELIEKKKIARLGIELSKDFSIALHVDNFSLLHPVLKSKVVKIVV